MVPLNPKADAAYCLDQVRRFDLDRYLAALAGRGYRGWVSLEYKPTGTTEASLAWLPRERRAAPSEEA